MRPRKNLLVLSPDNLKANLIPGRLYTTAKLSCMFDASPSAIAEVLITLEASGIVNTSQPICGRARDMRPERRIYWIPLYTRTDVAARRIGPAESKAELTGYDLTRFQRLAMTSRR
jgi:hypothetical protein